MPYVENGEERLQHLSNILAEKNVEHKRSGAGRREGDKELPDFLRVLIGSTARASNSVIAAKVFGVSQPTANTASKGKRSPGGEVIPELKGPIEDHIATARSKAVEGVMTALNLVPGKIDDSVKLKDLSAVAKDLAFVVDKLAPADEKAQKAPSVVFYMPREKDVKEFEVIEVPAKVEE